MRALLFLLVACGSSPTVPAVANRQPARTPAPVQTLETTEPDRNAEFKAAIAEVDKHDGRPWDPDCAKAIAHWFSHAWIDDKARERPFVDGCRQDRWSREARICFVWIDSLAPAAVSTRPDECRSKLEPWQQTNLSQRIRQLGETALDSTE